MVESLGLSSAQRLASARRRSSRRRCTRRAQSHTRAALPPGVRRSPIAISSSSGSLPRECRLPAMVHDRWSTRLRAAPIFLVIVMIAASLTGCGSTASAVPEATVAAFPGNSDPPLLVDAALLQAAQAAGDARLVIVDLSALRVYRRGHLTGAIHAWWQDTMNLGSLVYGAVRTERDDGRSQMAFLASLGIGDDSIIVAYDDQQNRYASLL